MATIGYILLFVAIYTVVAFLYKEEETGEVSLSETGIKYKEAPKWAVFLKGFAPLNKVVLGGILKNYGRSLGEKISLLRWDIRAEEFLSIKELAAIFVPLFLYLFGIDQPLILLFSVLVGFYIPDVFLNGKVRGIKEEIGRMLPEAVDLLSLCVGAGLNFITAMRWVINKSKPHPLMQQFRTILEEINIGKSRTEALRDMSKRIGSPDVTSFTRILIQTDKLGTPVEEAFKIISDDMRMRRFHRGERQAMKAPMKMLIPLIFCILPIILIIIGGPILLKFMKGGLFNLQV